MVSLTDYQFLDTFKRKRVKLTTKSSSFVGVVQRVNLNKTIILEHVEELQSGTRLPGAKLFFGREILNVEFALSSSHQSSDPESCKVSGVGALSVSEYQPYRRMLMEEDEVDEQWVNFVVVDDFHEKFGPALTHIRHQRVIGVGADGVGTFHQERLCWLQVATRDKVFLFDILMLGARAFKNGLSTVLASERILKVVHDCRGIASSMMAQFGVGLVNVFDTQVADVVHFYTLTGGFLPERVSTLQEVVSYHLKIPSGCLSSLKIKEQLVVEDKEMWYARPCPAPLLKVMAISVIHLQPLRLVLLDLLMSDYTDLVDSYLRSAQDDPVGTENIGEAAMELPKELRELETIRNMRRTQAMQFYQLTQDGLLKCHNANTHLDPDLKPQTLNHDYDLHSSTSLGPLESLLMPTAGHSANLVRSSTPNVDTQPGQDSPVKGRECTIIPGLGRGFTLSTSVPEVMLTQGSSLDKTEDMAGVAQSNLPIPGSHRFPGIGRGLFQRPL